jgi:hypothetical protein
MRLLRVGDETSLIFCSGSLMHVVLMSSSTGGRMPRFAGPMYVFVLHALADTHYSDREEERRCDCQPEGSIDSAAARGLNLP